MDPRYPRSAGHLAHRSSIRRRSGAFPSHEEPTGIEHSSHRDYGSASSVHSAYLRAQAEDANQQGTLPTVVLVRSRRNSLDSMDDTYSPSLPFQEEDEHRSRTFFSAFEDRDPVSESREHLPRYTQPEIVEDRIPGRDNHRHLPTHVRHVPLTPPALQPGRRDSEYSVQTTRTTTHSTASYLSRLPTPDLLRRGSSTIRSYLPRIFPVRNHSSHQNHLEEIPQHNYTQRRRPETSRPPTSMSKWSNDTTVVLDSPTSSSDSHSVYSTTTTSRYRSTTKRPELLPSFSTSSKLTQKFPISKSVRKLPNINLGTRGGSQGGSAFAATLLGEGEGLGIDRVDRWTAHKWCLFVSVCTLFVYGMAGLICAVLTWFKTWDNADVLLVTDYDILVLLTISSSIHLLAFLIGTTGTILNSRPILAVYALLLWPALISLLSIGYIAYKRATFSLDRKLNFAWSQWYTPLGRLIIQNSLHCCGFYSPLHEATASNRCYVRTSLPGCKGKLYAFEGRMLQTIWSTVFSLVPLGIANILVSLLCANHVTRTFGKGIMPKKYWLSGEDVRADAEKILKRFEKKGVMIHPGIARASSSSVFRQDREMRPLLEEEEAYHQRGI